MIIPLSTADYDSKNTIVKILTADEDTVSFSVSGSLFEIDVFAVGAVAENTPYRLEVDWYASTYIASVIQMSNSTITGYSSSSATYIDWSGGSYLNYYNTAKITVGIGPNGETTVFSDSYCHKYNSRNIGWWLFNYGNTLIKNIKFWGSYGSNIYGAGSRFVLRKIY